MSKNEGNNVSDVISANNCKDKYNNTARVNNSDNNNNNIISNISTKRSRANNGNDDDTETCSTPRQPKPTQTSMCSKSNGAISQRG